MSAEAPPKEPLEFNMEKAEVAFGPNGRTLGWYRWAAWYAEKCWDSHLLPEQVKNPAAAFTILCKGDEMGLPPFAAWSFIYITRQGRLAIMSKGALAVVQAKPAFGGYSERIEGEGPTLKAIAVATRKGQPPTIKEFSYQDAEVAGLLRVRTNRDGQAYDSTYQSYLKDMLLSRARGRSLDIAFAAELGGIPVEGIAEDIDRAHDDREGRSRAAHAAHAAKPSGPKQLVASTVTDSLLEELSPSKPEELVECALAEEPKPQNVSPVILPGDPREGSMPAVTEAQQAAIDASVEEAFPKVPTFADVDEHPDVKPGPPRRRGRSVRPAEAVVKACERCGTKLNAMDGCDACGWPGPDMR